MLVGGGRIIVAVVGAVALVIGAVFIVRALWWPSFDSSDSTASSTPSSSAVASGVTTSPTSADGDADESSSAEVTSTTGSDGGTTEESTPPVEPFTATTEHVTSDDGNLSVDVELPQVQGGQPAVATSFNEAMKENLDTQIASMSAGSLESGDDNDVTIGQGALSGVLSTRATDSEAAQPVTQVSTVVVNAESGEQIALSDVFTDVDAGLSRLVEQSQALGPTTDLGDDFDGSGLTASEDDFADWTAEKSGLRVYFDEGQVGPMAAGIVDLTIPWDDLSDVMTPEMAEILSS